MKDHSLKVLKEFLFKKKAAVVEQEPSWSKYFDVGAEQIKNCFTPIPCENI